MLTESKEVSQPQLRDALCRTFLQVSQLMASYFMLSVTDWFCSSINSFLCVRLTSSNSQIQNKRATKGFILIRHKRYQIYSCLQLSSSIASFVWKPAHFELRSYGGAWHNTTIAFVEKYTLISWFLAILGFKYQEKCFSKYFLVRFR